jgi:hypothetical protein
VVGNNKQHFVEHIIIQYEGNWQKLDNLERQDSRGEVNTINNLRACDIHDESRIIDSMVNNLNSE